MKKYTVVGLIEDERIAEWVEAESAVKAEEIVLSDGEHADLEVAGVFLGWLTAPDPQP